MTVIQEHICKAEVVCGCVWPALVFISLSLSDIVTTEQTVSLKEINTLAWTKCMVQFQHKHQYTVQLKSDYREWRIFLSLGRQATAYSLLPLKNNQTPFSPFVSSMQVRGQLNPRVNTSLQFIIFIQVHIVYTYLL